MVRESQVMLVAIHVSRKQKLKKDARIKSMLPPPPGARTSLTIEKVRILVPNFCLDPGLNLSALPNLRLLLRDVHLPGSSRSSSKALTVLFLSGIGRS